MHIRKYFSAALPLIGFYISVPVAPAFVVPPPAPDASCASNEYKENAQQAASSTAGDATVLMVVSGSVDNRHINTTQWIKMGRQVTVCIMGLHNWIYKNKGDPSTLRLVIGGYLLANIPPNSISPTGQEYLNFVLQMDGADSADWQAWAAIVNGSRHSHNNQLLITIGTTSRQVFESSAAVTVVPYPTYWKYLLAAFAVLLGALIYLSAKTNLLRYVVGMRPPVPERPP
jgi:hypothetical protein